MDVVSLFLSLIVWGLIFWLAWWGLARIGVSEPFNKVATVILVVASIIIVLGLLMGRIAPLPFVVGLLR